MKFLQFVFVSTLIFFCSCRTLEYKQKYFNNQLDEFGKKYALSVGEAVKDSSLSKDKKVPSMREIKLALKDIEKFWALFPDSTITVDSSVLYPPENGFSKIVKIPGSRVVDSFYYTSGKIEFIERNQLWTEHKHRLPVRR